jgi:hypothetical protein
MAKLKLPLDTATRKKLHEEWSELVTGSKDGFEFDPNDPAFSNLDVEMPPITHSFGKKGYEISVRSGTYYAVFSYMDKKEQIQKEVEIPLLSARSKSLSFPYKFQVNGKDKEVTEAEFKEIEAMLHSPKRRKSSS